MKLQRACLLVFSLLIALTPLMADQRRKGRVRAKIGPSLHRLQQVVASPAPQAPSVTTRGPGPTTIWVGPPPAGNDSPGCGSTELTPCATIQFALLEGETGDTIRVLPGTYNECISNLRRSLGAQKNFTVVANDWDLFRDRTSTIIDGENALFFDGLNGFVDCVFPFSAVNMVGTDLGVGNEGSRFEGFTVINAVSSGVLVAGSTVITNNVIRDNEAELGGGVFANSLTCFYGPATLEISGNDILRNTANDVFKCDTPPRNTCNTSNDCQPASCIATVCNTAPFGFCNVDSDCNDPTCDLTGGNGGGIFVLARAQELGGPQGCTGGDAVVMVEDNTIDSNGADNALGGGLHVLTSTDSGITATVTISTNVITNNSTLPFSIGYGGGAWISTYGYGVERIDFVGNTVVSNLSTGDGGGLSAWIDGLDNADHTINVNGNTVQSNIAEGGGGGMDLFALLRNVAGGANSAIITAERNTVASNQVQGIGFGLFPGVGGGIIANTDARRTSIGNFRIDVLDNMVRNNTASLAGGGIAAVARADADPDQDGGPDVVLSTAVTNVRNNLVTTNVASGGGTAVGGGIIAFAQARGGSTGGTPSLAELNLEFNTVAANISDTGSGGIEIESRTEIDGNNNHGVSEIGLNRSILFNNSGFAAGGPMRGSAGVLTTGGTGLLNLTYFANSLFMNDAGYESTLFPAPGPLDQFDDPELDGAFLPTQCSPTIDVIPTGSAEPGVEPEPNGDAFNLGHTGGLMTATKTLADVTGDGFVNGLDILRLALAFNAPPGSAREDLTVDLNEDLRVTGEDLALMCANFAMSCL